MGKPNEKKYEDIFNIMQRNYPSVTLIENMALLVSDIYKYTFEQFVEKIKKYFYVQIISDEKIDNLYIFYTYVSQKIKSKPLEKECTKCFIVKKISEFRTYEKPNGEVGHYSICLKCQNKREKEKRLLNAIKKRLALI